MAEGVGRRIASSPITADWLVSEALRRYPTTGEIFVQMTRLRTPGTRHCVSGSAGLTVGACAARNRIAVTSLLAQLNAAAEGEEFVGPSRSAGSPREPRGTSTPTLGYTESFREPGDVDREPRSIVQALLANGP